MKNHFEFNAATPKSNGTLEISYLDCSILSCHVPSHCFILCAFNRKIIMIVLTNCLHLLTNINTYEKIAKYQDQGMNSFLLIYPSETHYHAFSPKGRTLRDMEHSYRGASVAVGLGKP